MSRVFDIFHKVKVQISGRIFSERLPQNRRPLFFTLIADTGYGYRFFYLEKSDCPFYIDLKNARDSTEIQDGTNDTNVDPPLFWLYNN